MCLSQIKQLDGVRSLPLISSHDMSQPTDGATWDSSSSIFISPLLLPLGPYCPSHLLLNPANSKFFRIFLCNFLPLIHTFKSAVDNSRPDEVHFQISIISTEGSFHILGFSLELFLHWVYERHLINVFKVWVIKRCRPDLGGMINTFSNERQKRNLFSHWLKQTHTKWMNLVFAQKDFPNGSFLWAPSFALKAKAFISLHNCRIWGALGITPPQCF